MPRLPRTLVSVSRTATARLMTPASASASASARHLSCATRRLAKAPDSTPGWEGRPKEDHAVNRSPHDPEAQSAQEGMKEHEQLKEGSQAISRKDERDNNKRAKEDHPEAPEPVIGMNEERGSVSFTLTLPYTVSPLALPRWLLPDRMADISYTYRKDIDPPSVR